MNRTLLLCLVPFGLAIYLLDRFCVPAYGMVFCSVASACLVLVLLLVYLAISVREPDERERQIMLQADSAALYLVIAGLLAATIFYPRSEFAMVFWAVIGIAAVGRVIASLYHHYK
jgi:ABC-type iron transport system FetAB permease component